MFDNVYYVMDAFAKYRRKPLIQKCFVKNKKIKKIKK